MGLQGRRFRVETLQFAISIFGRVSRPFFFFLLRALGVQVFVFERWGFRFWGHEAFGQPPLLMF